MTECEEIAATLPLLRPEATLDDAIRAVRVAMPDESVTVVDNAAEALLRRSRDAKPRKGDVIHYRGERAGIVTEVDGRLCWVRGDDGVTGPFIWWFNDCGFNALHDWPGKARAMRGAS